MLSTEATYSYSIRIITSIFQIINIYQLFLNISAKNMFAKVRRIFLVPLFRDFWKGCKSSTEDIHLSMLSYQNHSTSTYNALRRHLESIPRSEPEPGWSRRESPSAGQGQWLSVIAWRGGMDRYRSVARSDSLGYTLMLSRVLSHHATRWRRLRTLSLKLASNSLCIYNM